MRQAKTRTGWIGALVAVVAWSGLVLQLGLSVSAALAKGQGLAYALSRYFDYFTVLTNLLVALVLTVPRVAPASTAGRFFHRPDVRTGVAAAIALVGIGYYLLLRQSWQPRGLQLVADGLLHYATPVLYLAFWWIAVPKQRIGWGHIAAWAAYPAGYFLYMLIRGRLTGRYPYYFLDVSKLGLLQVLGNAFAVLAAFLVLAAALRTSPRGRAGQSAQGPWRGKTMYETKRRPCCRGHGSCGDSVTLTSGIHRRTPACGKWANDHLQLTALLRRS